jgi:hypothetical protein
VIMLTRFCFIIDGDKWLRDGIGLDVWRLDVFTGVFAGKRSLRRWRVRPLYSLTPTLSLSRFVPDRQPPWHALGRESLSDLVNQS